ncbi:glycosyltransferase family 2 protein [Paraglaciecola sp.]|uniref:glycosyltransferase family 2 protein n=1 Tax=Paraglaciecola sp. TaxID=1920173 RepID=UPI003EF1ED77
MIASIIIPVFNDFYAIQLTLDALRKQTIDSHEFEIIVVDNGSKDGSVKWLQDQQDIVFISETSHLGSPYSCRNRGIEVAKGELVILLDSTCIPALDWLEAGINFYRETSELLFGGCVKFNFEDKTTIGKLYDSITNVQMEHSILHQQKAKTANLWVHKTVFSEKGMFREGVRSGEDVRWTKFCTDSGMHLGYSEHTKVYKFARGTFELLKKQIRVGKGQMRLWRSRSEVKKQFTQSLKKVLPISPKTMRLLMARNKDVEYTWHIVARLYLVSYLSELATLFGNVLGLFQKQKAIS